MTWLLHYCVCAALCNALSQVKGFKKVINLEAIENSQARLEQQSYGIGEASHTGDIIVIRKNLPILLIELGTGRDVETVVSRKRADWLIELESTSGFSFAIVCVDYQGRSRLLGEKFLERDNEDVPIRVARSLCKQWYSEMHKTLGFRGADQSGISKELTLGSNTTYALSFIFGSFCSELTEAKEIVNKLLAESEEIVPLEEFGNFRDLIIGKINTSEKVDGSTSAYTVGPMFNKIPNFPRDFKVEKKGTIRTKTKLLNIDSDFIIQYSNGNEPTAYAPTTKAIDDLDEHVNKSVVERNMSIFSAVECFRSTVLKHDVTGILKDTLVDSAVNFVRDFDKDARYPINKCPKLIRDALGFKMKTKTISEKCFGHFFYAGVMISFLPRRREDIGEPLILTDFDRVYISQMSKPLKIDGEPVSLGMACEGTPMCFGTDTYCKLIRDKFEEYTKNRTYTMLLKRNEATFGTLLKHWKDGHLEDVKVYPIYTPTRVSSEDDNGAIMRREIFGVMIIGSRSGQDTSDQVEVITIELRNPSLAIDSRENEVYILEYSGYTNFVSCGYSLCMHTTSFSLGDILRRSMCLMHVLVPFERVERSILGSMPKIGLDLETVEKEIDERLLLQLSKFGRLLAFSIWQLENPSLQTEHVQSVIRKLLFANIGSRMGFFGLHHEITKDWEKVKSLRDLSMLWRIIKFYHDGLSERCY